MVNFELAELDQDTNRITLTGRLDAAGTGQVELIFTATTAGAGRHVLIDLSGVDFIGSLGIRLLLGSARVVQRRGRKMVIFGVQEMVAEVFETVALSSLIPVAVDEAEARTLLSA